MAEMVWVNADDLRALTFSFDGRERLERLIEQGHHRQQQRNEPSVNRFGVDVAYFRKLFEREFGQALQSKTPQELARALARASMIADQDVAFETVSGEFISREEGEVQNGKAPS